MRRLTRLAAVAVSCAALTLTAACGEEGDDAGEDRKSDGGLSQLALTTEDLPDGFMKLTDEGTSGERATDSYTNECTQFLNRDLVKDPQVEVSFMHEEQGLPYVVEMLAAFDSPEAAQAALAEGVVPATCTAWTDTEPDESTTNYTYQPVEVAVLSDASYMGHAVLENSVDGTTELTLVAFTVGDTLCGLTIATSPENGFAAQDELINKAFEKVSRG